MHRVQIEMDSDDNCLVIDENIADMEVSSTSETPVTKDVCENENHNENEADSSMANSFIPLDESATPMTTAQTALDLSTNSAIRRDSSQGRTKSRDKEKERHREKRRSKDDRRNKTATPTNAEKYRNFSKKSNCIYFDESMLNERILNVS